MMRYSINALCVVGTYAIVTCTVDKTDFIGCFTDAGDDARSLNHTASHGDNSNSLEWCAAQCYAQGFTDTHAMFGVEYGTQCFCGNAFDPTHTPAQRPLQECQKMKCPGSHALPGEEPEHCGDANRLLVYRAKCAEGPNVPNWMPCAAGSPGAALPFCDIALPRAARVKDMISRMSLSQKCQQTDDKMGAIPEIGWHGYNWNTECLHGLGGICLTVKGVTRCPSVFAAPPLLGSSFNDTVAQQLGAVISDEIRAYSNNNGHRSYQNRPIGVSAWGPNLNIYRDARWGRNVEVPSEDPYHSGSYGVAYTKGLQWGDDDRYTKAIGALKHYTIYSVENGRGSTYFDISTYDIEDTYLPQFKAPVTKAKSLGYMCSYAALTNPELIPDSGEPSHPHSEPLCASRFFAQSKMRDEFGFEGYVQSDCGAVNNEKRRRLTYAAGGRRLGEGWARNASDAAARALADGMMNSNCGGGLVNNICEAIAEGLTTEAELEARVTRSISLLMDAGLFDPIENQTYTKIPFETINSEQAQAKNLEATRQGLVLLSNPLVLDADGARASSRTVLPLPNTGFGEGEWLLLGPHAQTQGSLAGNYYEDIGLGTCAGTGCVPTMEASLNVANAQIGGKGNVTVLQGCKDTKCGSIDADAIKAAVGAPAVKAVVLAMGIDSAIEGEGHDRTDIRFPGQQAALVQAVLDTVQNKGVRVVLLLFNGGTIAIEELKYAPMAIVECWYPGATGGRAIAEALFGFNGSNRFGKLPFTYYAYNFTQASPMNNMNMSTNTGGPGRSYKYLADSSLALWPFGFGLSYTTFSLSQHTIDMPRAVLRALPPWATGTAREHFRGSGSAAMRRALETRLETDTVATVQVVVTNTGTVSGDEVVFLYHNASSVHKQRYGSAAAAPPVAIKQLIAYQRVSLQPGAETTVKFDISARSLSTVDAHGTRHVLPGMHDLILSRGHGVELKSRFSLDLEGAPHVIVSTMESNAE